MAGGDQTCEWLALNQSSLWSSPLAALKLPEAKVVGLEQPEDDTEGQQPARGGEHVEQVLGQLCPDPGAAVAAAAEVDAQVDVAQVLKRRAPDETGHAHRVSGAGDPGRDAVDGQDACL
ncbi:uncharacterized protein PgNI_04056 [Pyricularia grisea]|uniref:Uncharacterized protein n=1 Tax=Pyricularia grisea TaxID=148305 RepID=A0A6P8BBQ8_PYRGI|nr:uncharacterized protein PgNI_04056 [Pyricularia grisea]TLD13234.1 hypothetical protein PgNI_04056 [Pyricularia grisea]